MTTSQKGHNHIEESVQPGFNNIIFRFLVSKGDVVDNVIVKVCMICIAMRGLHNVLIDNVLLYLFG